MGYRSQVACVISVDMVKQAHPTKTDVNDDPVYEWVYDKAKFKEMIGFIKLTKFWELWNTETDSIGWADGKFILYGADWKWYPDYEDVQAFDRMFEDMQDIEGISGYFLRVGEERDDIEEHEFGDDPCYDCFHAFTAMDFCGESYLGKRDTDDEKTATQDATSPQT